MKNLLFLFLAICLTSCIENPKSSSGEKPPKAVTKSTNNFEFIREKSEGDGDTKNTMQLYSVIGEFNLKALEKLCQYRADDFESGMFLYVVIFDEKANAIFPKNPITAEYGMEKKRKKHIKAMFTFNRLNGYSKLRTFKKNMWESKAKEYNISL